MTSGLFTAVKLAACTTDPSAASNPIVPAASGTSALEANPEASVTTVQLASPQACKRAEPAVTESTTLLPTAAVTPSPKNTLTANTGEATSATKAPLPGTLTSVITSGLLIAVNFAACVTTPSAASNPIVPAASGVTAVAAMPAASVSSEQLDPPPHAASPAEPLVTDRLTVLPAAAVTPSASNACTAKLTLAALPTQAPEAGAFTSRSTSALAVTLKLIACDKLP